jgi:hypothetical protein
MHHYEPESEDQSMVWNRLTSPVAKKFKSEPSADNTMLTLFLGGGAGEDRGSAILVHFTPKCETVNSQNYCDLLRMKMKLAISKLAKCKIA